MPAFFRSICKVRALSVRTKTAKKTMTTTLNIIMGADQNYFSADMKKAGPYSSILLKLFFSKLYLYLPSYVYPNFHSWKANARLAKPPTLIFWSCQFYHLASSLPASRLFAIYVQVYLFIIKFMIVKNWSILFGIKPLWSLQFIWCVRSIPEVTNGVRSLSQILKKFLIFLWLHITSHGEGAAVFSSNLKLIFRKLNEFGLYWLSLFDQFRYSCSSEANRKGRSNRINFLPLFPTNHLRRESSRIGQGLAYRIIFRYPTFRCQPVVSFQGSRQQRFFKLFLCSQFYGFLSIFTVQWDYFGKIKNRLLLLFFTHDKLTSTKIRCLAKKRVQIIPENLITVNLCSLIIMQFSHFG